MTSTPQRKVRCDQPSHPTHNHLHLVLATHRSRVRVVGATHSSRNFNCVPKIRGGMSPTLAPTRSGCWGVCGCGRRLRGDLALEYMSLLVVISLWRDIIPHGCVSVLSGCAEGRDKFEVSVLAFSLVCLCDFAERGPTHTHVWPSLHRAVSNRTWRLVTCHHACNRVGLAWAT
jgi:hypothetical protein